MASTLKQMTSKVDTYDADVKTTDADVKTIDIDAQTNDIEGQYKGNRRSIQWQSKVNTKASDNVTIAIEGQYIRRSTTYIRLFLPPVSGEAFDIRPLTFVLRP